MIPQDTARSFQDKNLVTFSNVLRATMSEAAREPEQGQFPFNKLSEDKYSNHQIQFKVIYFCLDKQTVKHSEHEMDNDKPDNFVTAWG